MDDDYEPEDMMGNKGGQVQDVDPAQVQRFLGGIGYPATKDELIEYAQRNGADEGVLDALRRIPGQSFETPADVNQAIGKIE